MRTKALTAVMTGAAAAVGSAGTDPRSAWYTGLDKPSWQPPGYLFPLVWTPLYGLIAWGTGRMIDRATPQDRARLVALTGADLAVNAGWCWAFFKKESPASGLAAIALLDALNVVLVREAAARDKAAGAALLPYAVWTGFATALNASIWRRNR
ncbi:MAG TPA: TspO/MBR family protein [Nocardioidaceae bacterium]|nr:TspO/MBR family protein [Nocardioidaceae bacterium]